MDFCLVSCAWRNCHNFSEPSVGKANHTSNRKLQPQPKPKQMEQKHVLLAWFTLPKWMQNSPKPKQMQQSNPDVFLPWLTLPKWMKPNPKPKQLQQVSPNAMAVVIHNAEGLFLSTFSGKGMVYILSVSFLFLVLYMNWCSEKRVVCSGVCGMVWSRVWL